VLAILTTHPIQYQVPLWQALARRGDIDFQVWYMSNQGAREYHDPDFGRRVQWDLPLLEGYPFRFLETAPVGADLTTFRGTRIQGAASLLRQQQPAALWITGWHLQAYLQLAAAARLRGIPVWLRGESNDMRRRPWTRRLARDVVLRTLFAQIERFFFIGSANRRLYIAHGVPDRKLFPAPYCVDNERFARAALHPQPTRDELRRRWRIPPDATTFLICGKLIPQKRPLDPLRAALRVVQDRPDLRGKIHIVLVGTGELQRETELAARELQAICGREVVTWAGFMNQTEIPAAYVAADWLVLASDARETWGLVVNEALASGTPVLASDQCGCAEDLVRPLSPSLVYPCGDVEALAARMIAILTGAIDRPTAAMCQSVVATHDLTVTVDSITRSYREVNA
jgi:glycosyltransferase involved in cell wall biosynthesis